MYPFNLLARPLNYVRTAHKSLPRNCLWFNRFACIPEENLPSISQEPCTSKLCRYKALFRSKQLIKILPHTSKSFRSSFDIYSTPSKISSGGNGSIAHIFAQRQSTVVKSAFKKRLTPIKINESALREKVAHTIAAKEEIATDFKNAIENIKNNSPELEMAHWVKAYKQKCEGDKMILKYINEHKKQILKRTFGAKIAMTEQLTKAD